MFMIISSLNRKKMFLWIHLTLIITCCEIEMFRLIGLNLFLLDFSRRGLELLNLIGRHPKKLIVFMEDHIHSSLCLPCYVSLRFRSPSTEQQGRNKGVTGWWGYRFKNNMFFCDHPCRPRWSSTDSDVWCPAQMNINRASAVSWSFAPVQQVCLICGVFFLLHKRLQVLSETCMRPEQQPGSDCSFTVVGIKVCTDIKLFSFIPYKNGARLSTFFNS